MKMSTESDLFRQIRSAGLHPPENMTMMVTDGCNLRCRHCWLDCRGLKNAVPVDADAIIGVVNAFAGLGGIAINLTGGEILSHPDWFRILKYCLNHSSLERVCLQTNATLIARRHVEAWLALASNKLTLQVSLDGACAQTHDHVRGEGSYDRALAGLHLLAQAGLGPQTQVAFTEMAHNFDEFPQLLEMVDRMGLARLISGTIIAGGRAAASTHVSLPTPDQYRRLLQRYQNDALFRKRYEQKGSISAIEWFKNRAGSAPEACGCLKDLFVNAQGHLFPCTMLLLERYASQSVYSHPFNRVIENALPKWREIPLLHRKRHDAIASCKACTGRRHCRGGCLGRAAALDSDLMAPEDRCALRQVVYDWDL
jgi:radical SAM protein with 4Fe4S-binding SPASM domain